MTQNENQFHQYKVNQGINKQFNILKNYMINYLWIIQIYFIWFPFVGVHQEMDAVDEEEHITEF